MWHWWISTRAVGSRFFSALLFAGNSWRSRRFRHGKPEDGSGIVHAKSIRRSASRETDASADFDPSSVPYPSLQPPCQCFAHFSCDMAPMKRPRTGDDDGDIQIAEVDSASSSLQQASVSSHSQDKKQPSDMLVEKEAAGLSRGRRVG